MPKGKYSLVFAISVSTRGGFFHAYMLKASDVLNRYSDSGNPEHTVHHLKYIFPRQFGLHNVFTCSVDTRETSHAFKDYTLREQEIALDLKRFRIQQNDQCKKLGSRLPKRLRGPLFQLIGKLQRLHNKCSYLELLKYYCPVIVSFQTLLFSFLLKDSCPGYRFSHPKEAFEKDQPPSSVRVSADLQQCDRSSPWRQIRLEILPH